MGNAKAIFTQVIWRLRQTLVRHNLLPTSERIIIALSGGQDSIALTESLGYLHQREQWKKFSLAYCDHRWPHDDGNADLVRQYAKHRGFTLHIIDAADGNSPVSLTEGAARDWRYDQLTRLAHNEGFDSVVTAHTRTDLAETVLFNLVNGAGADGLGALTWKRKLCEEINLVRPFLDISREQTAQFCDEQRLEIWNDVYNSDHRYARNRIRADVMPILRKSLNAHVESALARTAHILRDESQFLEEEANKVYPTVVLRSGQSIGQTRKSLKCCRMDCDNGFVIGLDKKVLLTVGTAIQRRVIRRFLRDHVGLNHNGATFFQVETIRSLLSSPVGSSVSSLSGQATAIVSDDDVIAFLLPLRRSEQGQQSNTITVTNQDSNQKLTSW